MMFTLAPNVWGLTPRIGCFKKVVNLMRQAGHSVSIVPLGRRAVMTEVFHDRRYIQ